MAALCAVWRPGFGVPFAPELNVDKQVLRNLRAHLKAMRDGAGPNVDLLLDLNFNAKTKGYPKILRAIADFEMFWVEIDSYSPAALAHIRGEAPIRSAHAKPYSDCANSCVISASKLWMSRSSGV
jgi:L-alanine-DL-glutamate epimerase-like enolase superfamily enzyme